MLCLNFKKEKYHYGYWLTYLTTWKVNNMSFAANFYVPFICTVWAEPIWMKVSSSWLLLPEHQSTYYFLDHSNHLKSRLGRVQITKKILYFFGSSNIRNNIWRNHVLLEMDEYLIWKYSNFEFQYSLWSDSNFEYKCTESTWHE